MQVDSNRHFSSLFGYLDVAQALMPAASALMPTLAFDTVSRPRTGVETSLDTAGTSAQCHLVFDRAANSAESVGRTPWSARDALVPLPEQRYQHLAGLEQADEGVGRGPGGPPHPQGRMSITGKTKWHWARVPAPHGLGGV